MDTGAIILTIAGAILGGGTVGAIITAVVNRRKTKAEAGATEADTNEQIRQTVMSLIAPLNERIRGLECELRNVRAENAAYRRWAEALVNQVKQLGGVPVPYHPPEPDTTPTIPRTGE